jgi:hypothetical protein
MICPCLWAKENHRQKDPTIQIKEAGRAIRHCIAIPESREGSVQFADLQAEI